MRYYDDEADYRSVYLLRMQLLIRMMLLMMLLAVGMFVMMQILRLLPGLQLILEAQAQIMKAQADGLKLIPDLEARIQDLDKRTKTLSTSEVEGRLARLETAIRVGEVRAEDIASLQDLREEVKLLQTYMFSQPERLIEFRTLQSDYLRFEKVAETVMPRDEILRELNSTKQLFYWNLAVFGVLVSMFAGAWFLVFRQNMRVPMGAGVTDNHAPKSSREAHTSADGEDR